MKELAILNRKNVFEKMSENSLMILFAGELINRSADADYPFSINRNFYYLTMIDEPNLVLLMEKGKDGNKATLFIEEVDLLFEKWVGKKINEAEAKAQSGITEIRYLKDLTDVILESVKDKTAIYLDFKNDEEGDNSEMSLVYRSMLEDLGVVLDYEDAYPVIAACRAIKSTAEIEEMKKAIHITREALDRVMKHLKSGDKEYQIEAEFNYVLNKHQSPTAFETIAASGINAVTLHYVKNDDELHDNELILFDLGASSKHYCADISRTYPISGTFTERQKELYKMVLTIQKQVIAAIKPGVTILQLNQMVIDYYKKALKDHGVITDEEDVKNYYYHGVSHSLGLDTHDIGISRDQPLVAGNVVTVEPGIYIKEEAIGIRIEDDVLVTEDGGINLSAEIIKEVDEIESFMRK